MTRILASVSTVALLVAAAHAQCLGAPAGVVQTLTPTGGFAADDEGRTVPAQALGFTFPMAGALPFAPGATHAFIESNGEIYLTNSTYGIFAPVGPSVYGINSIGEWRGGANGSPRIAPWGGDSEAGTGPWAIYLDTTVPNQATIYWDNIWEYTGGFPVGTHSVSCTLYSTGEIDFNYGPIGTFPTAPFHSVGVSIGNNVGTGAEVSQDLSAGQNSGSLGLLFEDFFTVAPDLEGRTLRFTPNGLGGFITSFTCTGAYHQAYGVGCYGPQASQSIYQNFGTPAQALALNGNSMKAFPTANGYVFTWGGGTYLAPTGGATTLVLTDDSETDVTPSIAFPTPTGAVPTLSVCSNGFVNMGPSGNNSVFAYGSVFALLNAVIPSFRSNSDYDPASSPAVGAGVKTEEIGGILYVTWDQIERYATTGVNDTWQFQLNLNTGEVTWVWSAMQGTVGGAHVVGYSPGVSLDGGSRTLSTFLPFVSSPDYNGVPLDLSASPAPVYTPGNPTVPVTYTLNNVVDLVPPFGIGLSFLLFSVAPLPGIDLGFLGMPGCNLNIASLDVILNMPGTAPTAALTFSIPQPLFPGLSFYSQGLDLFAPNSLPNGQNPFGGILSNGVQSYFNIF